MDNELKLPSGWPEDFSYTDEGGLTPEQAQQGMSAAAAQRTGKKTEGAGKNDWMRKYIGTKG